MKRLTTGTTSARLENAPRKARNRRVVEGEERVGEEERKRRWIRTAVKCKQIMPCTQSTLKSSCRDTLPFIATVLPPRLPPPTPPPAAAVAPLADASDAAAPVPARAVAVVGAAL